ncbi:hypothetical protein AAFC00_004090 [Neodothiora populina]
MNGTPTARTTSPPYHDTSLSPSGYRSLSSIALHAFALGTSLGLCVLLAPYLALHHNRLWRLPEFIATLCIFHFLEFYTTARWNTPNARVSSFLLFSNGAAYNVAHASAMVEIAVSSLLFPRWQALGSSSLTLAVGAAMVVVGQVVRSVAMAEAGKSFNHIPQRKKRDDHVLVTSGVYAWVRHPSYFGYYYFAVGTQVVVGNKVCALVYAGVLWVFFRNRIADEEQYLIEFFGEEYVTFKKNVGTGLLFIK